MTVRKGTIQDIEAIIEMAREFWKHTAYDEPYDPETVDIMAESCIDHDMMSVLEINGEVQGFACGVVGPLLGNRHVKSGTEIAWWVNQAHRRGSSGIRLLDHLECLAKDQGVKYWNMIYMLSSMPKEIRAIYEARGYQEVETAFMKVL